MKKLFRRVGKADTSRKRDSFFERDTYWDEDEQGYDWDSVEEEQAEEQVEEAEDHSEDTDFLEEGAESDYEPIGDPEDFSEAVGTRLSETEARDTLREAIDRAVGYHGMEAKGSRKGSDDYDIDDHEPEAASYGKESDAAAQESFKSGNGDCQLEESHGVEGDCGQAEAYGSREVLGVEGVYGEECAYIAEEDNGEEAYESEGAFEAEDAYGEGYAYGAEDGSEIEEVYEPEGGYRAEGDYGEEYSYVEEEDSGVEEAYEPEEAWGAEDAYEEEYAYGAEEGYGQEGAYESEEAGEEEAFYEAEGISDDQGDFRERRSVRSAGGYRNTGRESAARYTKNVANREKTRQKQEAGFFYKIGRAVRSMDVMDHVMVVTGVVVLVLAIVMGSMFIRINATNRQIDDFSNVGKQLEGIAMIGENGLMAVANVQMAKFGEASTVPESEAGSDNGYDEAGYERKVSVEPNFTSIQKDLKIKFINKNSDKLVANVPFAVTVTDPDGKEQIWSDDDMDGIIHKKDIAPGTYLVAMEPLTDEKYANYTVMTDRQSVEVKKEIVYEKVNVANEVKQESEVNVAQEDTRKNETVVESVLKDTVAWVESKVISATYNEVAKSTIPDPVTLVMAWKPLYLSSEEGEGSVPEPSSEEPPVTEIPAEPTPEPATPAPTEAPTPEPATPAPTEAPTSELATPTPTAASTPEPATPTPTVPPTQAPTADPTGHPTPTPEAVLDKGKVTVTPTELNAIPGTKLAAQAISSGFTSGERIVYTIASSNTAVATATIDAAGNIDISTLADGTAVLTVAANYEKGDTETLATASISVKVQSSNALALDQTALTIYATIPTVINASFSDTAVAATALTAESSDTGIATVSVDKTAITVTGVKEGVAIITVKCKLGNQDVSAACSVTVNKHPRENNVTLLKDANGQQLYIMSGNDYREATWADYYTADKFFIKGEAKYSGWQTLDGKVYYFQADGKKVTGEQVIQGAKYNFASDGSLVVGNNGSMGIDVSKWNGNINWNAVKNSGVSYVIIRCGYRGSSTGQLIADPKFETNIKGAVAAGLKVGVYFFSQAVDEMEAVEEASMVLDQIRNYKISYPVFLDVEASGGRADQIDKATRTAVCKAFCQTIKNGGYTTGIYANKTWLEGKIDTSSLSAYKIWLAQYAASPTYKGRYDLWQYRSTGSISGISGNVDLNISYLGY